MNALRLPAPSPRLRAGLSAARVIRYREPVWGSGYGTRSGYAMDRRYTSDWAAAPFRCR